MRHHPHIGRSPPGGAQSGLICAPQPVIAEEPPVVQNGGSGVSLAPRAVTFGDRVDRLWADSIPMTANRPASSGLAEHRSGNYRRLALVVLCLHVRRFHLGR